MRLASNTSPQNPANFSYGVVWTVEYVKARYVYECDAEVGNQVIDRLVYDYIGITGSLVENNSQYCVGL
jgi:hypothetical protein